MTPNRVPLGSLKRLSPGLKPRGIGVSRGVDALPDRPGQLGPQRQGSARKTGWRIGDRRHALSESALGDVARHSGHRLHPPRLQGVECGLASQFIVPL